MTASKATVLRSSVVVCAILTALVLPVCGAPAWAAASAAAPKELVAVMDMEAVGATDAQATALTDRLREILLNSGRYTLVDRSEMKAILKEQAFQQSGCTSQECAVKVGSILGVRRIVTSRVVKAESGLWLISAMLINVETAQTMAAESVQYQGSFAGLLSDGIAELGAKLTGEAMPVAASKGMHETSPAPGTPDAKARALEAGAHCYSEVGARYRVWFAVGYISTYTPALTTLTLAENDRAGCKRQYGVSSREADQYFFVSTNQSHVLQNMSQGSGTYLRSLAGLMGCEQNAYPPFAHMAQQRYEELSSAAHTSSAELLVTLKREMRQQPVLQACLNRT